MNVFLSQPFESFFLFSMQKFNFMLSQLVSLQHLLANGDHVHLRHYSLRFTLSDIVNFVTHTKTQF